MVARRAAKRRPAKRPRRKTPTNLSLREDLVRRARALDLNLSEVVEAALEQVILELERSSWVAENQQGIDDYNAFVAKHGVFGDSHRQF